VGQAPNFYYIYMIHPNLGETYPEQIKFAIRLFACLIGMQSVKGGNILVEVLLVVVSRLLQFRTTVTIGQPHAQVSLDHTHNLIDFSRQRLCAKKTDTLYKVV